MVNPEMSKPKIFYYNSLNSDTEIQLKWRYLEFFNFTFFEILTTIYDFDLLGLF